MFSIILIIALFKVLKHIYHGFPHLKIVLCLQLRMHRFLLLQSFYHYHLDHCPPSPSPPSSPRWRTRQPGECHGLQVLPVCDPPVSSPLAFAESLPDKSDRLLWPSTMWDQTLRTFPSDSIVTGLCCGKSDSKTRLRIFDQVLREISEKLNLRE